jgi:hypothetical protein
MLLDLDMLLNRNWDEINSKKFEQEQKSINCDWCGGFAEHKGIPCNNCLLDFEQQKSEPDAMSFMDYFPL